MSLEKITDKIYDLTPAFIFRWKDFIYTKYRNLTSSFINWKNGYGWFPDSQVWDLYGAISRFALPRLKLFIADQKTHISTPYPFHQMENGNQKWIEILIAMQVAFMEEGEWFRWKYPNQKHPIYDVDVDTTTPYTVETDDKHLLELNPKWMKQFDWDEAHKYRDEYQKEYKEGCKLLGEYFGSLWD